MKCFARSLILFAGIGIFCLVTAAYAQTGTEATEQAVTAGPRARYWLAYFPLEAGNEWVYSDGAASFTVQVLGATLEANGMRYFEVSGYFPGDPARVRKLRQGAFGQILEYNPAGEDFLWYGFENFRGAWSFESGVNIPCIVGSRVGIGEIGGKVDAPAGSFERILRLDFAPPCMDAGIASEYFADGVGLVQRVTHTIAGPRTVKLVAARVGRSVLPAAAYGIEVSANRPVYYNNLMPPVVNPWPTARVRLTVRNETEWPVEFTFPTSQRFEFIVRDASGKEVLRWSDGQAFLQAVGRETLLGGSRSYAEDLVLRGRDGKPLPAGLYTLVGYLTTPGSEAGNFSMFGSLTFEIRDIY